MPKPPKKFKKVQFIFKVELLPDSAIGGFG